MADKDPVFTKEQLDLLKKAGKAGKDLGESFDYASSVSKRIAENMEKVNDLSKISRDLSREIVSAEKERDTIGSKVASIGKDQAKILNEIAIHEGAIHAYQLAEADLTAKLESQRESLELLNKEALRRSTLGTLTREEAVLLDETTMKIQNQIGLLKDTASVYRDMIKSRTAELNAVTEEKKLLESFDVAKKQVNALISQRGEIEKNISCLGVMPTIINSILGGLSSTSKSFGNLRGLIGSLKTPMSALVFLVESAIDRWIELDKAAEDFRRKTGLIRGQSDTIERSARQVNIELVKYGVNLKEAYNAAAALTEELQVAGLVTQSMIKSTAMYAANLGISEKNTAAIYGKFTALAKASGTTTDNVMMAGVGLAHMAGVPINAVMSDMANASSETLAFLGKSPMMMMKTAIEARRLGTTLESMSKSARGLLNFQDSINSEMEASALVGKNVNFQLSRQLAFEGDIEGSRKAALEQIEMAGDFSKMNVYQQEALAKAAGMTVDEVVKQQNQQEMLNALKNSANADDRAAYAEMMKYEEEKNKKSSENALDRGRKLSREMSMQAKMAQMTNALNEAWLSIQEAMMPIADVIMPVFIGGVKLLSKAFIVVAHFIKGMLTPFTKLVDLIKSSKTLTDAWSSGLEWVEGVFSKLNDCAEWLGEHLYYISIGSKLLGNIFEKIGGGILRISDNVLTFGSRLTGINKAFLPIVKGFSSILGFVGKFTKFIPVLGWIISGVQFLYEYVKDLFGVWSDNSASFGEKILKSLAGIPKALWNVFVQPIVDIADWIFKKLGIAFNISDFLKEMYDNIIDFGSNLIYPIVKGFMGAFDAVTDIFQGNFLSGIKKGIVAAGDMIFGTFLRPFYAIWEWLSDHLLGNSPSELGLGIVRGISAVGDMVYKFLTAPFDKAIEFIKSLGFDKIIGMVMDIGSKIGGMIGGAVGSLFGGSSNKTATLSGTDELTSAIKELTAVMKTGIPTEVKETSTQSNGSDVGSKIDELIDLLKSGAIAVNLDGKKVSSQLATSYGRG